ncbi:MAG TPA: hypothetical protein VIY27_04370 [Myxococcota bacterium]
MMTHATETTDYRARRAANRRQARNDAELRATVRELVARVRTGVTVARVRGDLAQSWINSGSHASGFRWLQTRDQNAVVRSVLDSLVREGFCLRGVGLGEHGREAHDYYMAD